jgi:hypothetical protein
LRVLARWEPRCRFHQWRRRDPAAPTVIFKPLADEEWWDADGSGAGAAQLLVKGPNASTAGHSIGAIGDAKHFDSADLAQS